MKLPDLRLCGPGPADEDGKASMMNAALPAMTRRVLVIAQRRPA
jgi:hypothetical protein